MDTFQSPTPSGRRDKAEPGPVSVTIPASPFMQKLGFGTGVSVYLMKRSPRGLPRSPWAVKKINSGCSQSQRSLFQRRLREEARTLRNLRHPNIVGYRALTKAPDGSLCLAMEFGGEKSLNDLIEERREQGLGMFPAATILHVALSMARGLQYLHTEQRLLHGDIKSPNVVVRGAFEAVKICDVGVSLPLDENLTVSDPSLCYVGTEPWPPPEALEPGGAISDRADVFAFGLTLWEMLALSVPHLPPPRDDGSDGTGTTGTPGITETGRDPGDARVEKGLRDLGNRRGDGMGWAARAGALVRMRRPLAATVVTALLQLRECRE
ncbi:lymphokine-activated killer T-cell-originated protein kinase [Geospiza fortis]|uniref:Lymphokine-activated killer T-cell-originated protein kinase n=1 Tax=Geospiza fortis TaxID=48883 RepID=A0A8N5EZQ0_GEOFO|nr:lymphokine-activated killer T-cell-originated protein kinase [Geospiza fortis]